MSVYIVFTAAMLCVFVAIALGSQFSFEQYLLLSALYSISHLRALFKSLGRQHICSCSRCHTAHTTSEAACQRHISSQHAWLLPAWWTKCRAYMRCKAFCQMLLIPGRGAGTHFEHVLKSALLNPHFSYLVSHYLNFAEGVHCIWHIQLYGWLMHNCQYMDSS